MDRSAIIAQLRDKLDRARMRRNRARTDREFSDAVQVCDETLEALDRLGANPVGRVPSVEV